MLTLEEVLNAPSVAPFIGQLECARRADGAAAIIVERMVKIPFQNTTNSNEFFLIILDLIGRRWERHMPICFLAFLVEVRLLDLHAFVMMWRVRAWRA